jgi:poly-gamma-glutamate synthesis protein (capsule biosynthesis protein)
MRKDVTVRMAPRDAARKTPSRLLHCSPPCVAGFSHIILHPIRHALQLRNSRRMTAAVPRGGHRRDCRAVSTGRIGGNPREDAVKTTVLFAGDINLAGIADPAGPFPRVAGILGEADLRFANLECSFFEPRDAITAPPDGLQAGLGMVEALSIAGFDVVGTANNGNYGAEAIVSTARTLAGAGILQTGCGVDAEEAYRPAIAEADGVRIGILQRTSVYWPMGHEAGDHGPGVAVLQGHTSYKLPLHRTGLHVPPLNRPGVPLEAVTWADPGALKRLRGDIEELRARCDIVIASHHWGLKRDVLGYMSEIAHAAIEAGADAVIGHGPHHPMAVEVYKGCPIFYSLSSFCFNVGHSGKRSGNWTGMMARIAFDGRRPVEAAFRWVRHNEADETYFPHPRDEAANLDDVAQRSKAYGTRFEVAGDEVRVAL